MRNVNYGKLQIMQQPHETREIWRSRHKELEPSPEWGLSCLYEQDPTEPVETRELVRVLFSLANLTPREELVIEYHVVRGHTLDETSKMIGMGWWLFTDPLWTDRERVRQIREKAFSKLRMAYYKHISLSKCY